MEHLGIEYFQKYFWSLGVRYIDDITKFYYDICELAKVTKQYIKILRPWPEIKYSKIYSNLIGPITLHGF